MIYEVKKLLFRKEVWIVLGLSVLAMCLLCMRNADVSFRRIRIAHSKTAAYYDMPLDEAEAMLSRELNQLGPDPAAGLPSEDPLRGVLSGMNCAAQAYRSHEKKMQALIRKMYADLDHAATDFERRDLTHAIRLYNRKTDYHLCDIEQLDFAFLAVNHDETMQYLFLLILCTLLAPLFAMESETGMYQILFPSRKGRGGLYLRKIGAGVLCAAMFALLYTFLIVGIVWCKAGLSVQMLFAPIRSVPCYQYCPYPVSILTFFLLSALMRTLTGCLIAALTAFASCFFRRTPAVFGAAAGVTASLVLLSAFFAYVPDGQLVMKRLGLLRLSVPGEYLINYDTVNVFGWPVAQIWLSAACTCCIIAVISVAAFLIYTRPTTDTGKQVKQCSVSKN